MLWNLLQQGKNAADYNMALDEALLHSAPKRGRPLMRFYGWTEPAASFGYSQKYAEIEKITLLRPLVRRPTGGGLVPHQEDWTYSVVVPPNDPWHRLKAVESYRRIHQWVRAAFAAMGVATALSERSQKEIPGQCFLGAEAGDLMWEGRKIAGAAQRRTRSGLLIQGSVQPPPLGLSRTRWEESMRGAARQMFLLDWQPLVIDDALRELTETLRATKYSQPGYNRRR